MAGDGQPPATDFQVFPTLRRRGPVALVGLNSGVPKPPFFATGTLGEAQIAAAEKLLADLGREGLCRVVLIHHPPLTTEKHFKRLTDAAAFQAMIRRVGCELVLHGHNHRSEVARIDGPAGAGAGDRRHLGLGGARQQVRPRALPPDPHRARGDGLAPRRRYPRACAPTAPAANPMASSCSEAPPPAVVA